MRGVEKAPANRPKKRGIPPRVRGVVTCFASKEAEMRDLDKHRMGELIRRLRERRGMTQRELAQAAGIGESALRSYELGVRYPKERYLAPLAQALGVRPEVFEVMG